MRRVSAAGEIAIDRGYDTDGQMLPRDEPGALLTEPDEIAERLVRLVRDGELTIDGGAPIEVSAETVCLHADTPGAGVVALAIGRALDREGIEVRPLVDVLSNPEEQGDKS